MLLMLTESIDIIFSLWLAFRCEMRWTSNIDFSQAGQEHWVLNDRVTELQWNVFPGGGEAM